MEMIWEGSDSLGKSSWLFTGAFHDGYSAPSGFNFDQGGDDPIKDDWRLHDFDAWNR